MSISDYQGGYTAAPASAYAGLTLSSDFENIFSRQVETAAVGFGLAVGRGTADTGVKLGGTGFEGITVADKTQVDSQYDVGITAGVLNKGYIWVTASVALAPGDTLYFVPATGVITNVSTSNTAIPNSQVLNTAASGGLALLFLG